MPQQTPALAMSPDLQRLEAAIDPDVDPCQDFYRYACGNWLAKADAEAQHRNLSMGRGRTEQDARQVIQGTIEAALGDVDAQGVPKQPLGRFMAACMRAPQPGLHPQLATRLADLATVAHGEQVAVAVAGLHRTLAHLPHMGPPVMPLFGLVLSPDLREVGGRIHLELMPLVLPLGDRHLYLSDDPHAKRIRAAYLNYMEIAFAGAGDAEARSTAEAIFGFERELAELSDDHAARHAAMAHDPKIFSMEQLLEHTPGFDWRSYLGRIPGAHELPVLVRSPAGLKRVLNRVADRPIELVRAYLRWNLLHAMAPHHGGALSEAEQSFARALQAGPMMPRSERCQQLAVEQIYGTIDRSYLDQRFNGESRAQAQAMAESIRLAFVAGLSQLNWMDEATRAAAQRKAEVLHVNIGYPDELPDPPPVVFSVDDHLGNMFALSAHLADREWATLGQVWPRTAWPPQMSVTRDAAAFHPANVFFMTAAFLQSPVFDISNPLAMNYGAAGVVMGHEISHGFDSHGHRRDEYGRERNWWSVDAKGKFWAAASCVVDQYASCEPLPGLRSDPRMTLGENLADFGGIRSAYRAMEQRLAGEAETAHTKHKLTHAQLFFVSYAQLNCTQFFEPHLRAIIRRDPHSFGRCRVEGALRNAPEFWQAFTCEAGTPMHPEQSCQLW